MSFPYERSLAGYGCEWIEERCRRIVLGLSPEARCVRATFTPYNKPARAYLPRVQGDPLIGARINAWRCCLCG
jgi:hypothetical protein